MNPSARIDPFLLLAAGALLAVAAPTVNIWVLFLPLLLATHVTLTRLQGKDNVSPPISPPFRLGTLLLLSVCFVLKPSLSDDYQRYLWEGFVQNEGYSPYLTNPESLYDALDHPAEGKINNPGLSAIYPPLAQYLFRLTALLDPSVYAWKALILVCLLGTMAMASPAQRLVLLTCPLVLFEGVWNAHLDVIGLLPGFLLVQCLGKRRALGAGVMLAAMVGLKLIPLVLFPPCFLFFRGREKASFGAGFGLVLFLIYLPFLDQLPELFHSFVAFSKYWFFNNPIYHLLREIWPNGAARSMMGLILLCLYPVIVFSRAGVDRKCLLIWVAVTVLSPTVFPWYLTWLLPFVPLDRSRYLHLLYAASFLSYLVLIPFGSRGVWEERWWWMLPEWVMMGYCLVKLLQGARKS